VAQRLTGRKFLGLALDLLRTRIHDENPSYDAFISYNRSTDAKLAKVLQESLNRYATPWYQLRTLRIFRDDGNLGANTALGNSIEGAIDAARFLILLACEESAKSEWVEREVRYWCERKSSDAMLIVLTDPTDDRRTSPRLAWDKDKGDFDWSRTTAVGRYLSGVFHDEPRYVDLGWARSRDDISFRDPLFTEAVADVAAPLRGIPKDELIGEDVRQHKRTRAWVWRSIVALSLLTILTLTAAVVAIRQRNNANARTAVAEAEQFAAEAQNQADPYAAVSLAIAAERRTPSPLPRARAAYSAASSRLSNWTYRIVADYVGQWGIEAASAITWTSDGQELDVARPDGAVLRWKFSDGSTLPEVGPIVRSGLSVRWSADRRTQILADGKSVIVRDTRSDSQSGRHYAVGGATDAALSPDGRVLLTTDLGGVLRRWNPESGDPIGGNLGQPPSSFPHVSWSPDGTQFAMIDSGSSAFLGGLQVRDSVSANVSEGFAGNLWSLAWSPDGTRIAVGEEGGPIHVLNIREKSTLTLNGHVGRVQVLKWTTDGRLLASAGDDGTIRLWSGLTGSPVGAPLSVGAGTSALNVDWSPNGKYLAGVFQYRRSLARYSSASADHVAVWEVNLASSAGTMLQGLASKVTSLGWSTDGRYIAGADGTALCVWDSGSHATLAVMRPAGQAFGDEITNLAWSPDGSTIATAGDDGVRIWHWSTNPNDQPRPLWNSGGSVTLAWSPDGTKLASANDRGLVQIWSTVDLKLTTISITQAQQSAVPAIHARAVAWSEKGDEIFGVTNDGYLMIWNLMTSELTAAPKKVSAANFTSIGWSRDRRSIAIGSQVGSIRIISLEGAEEVKRILTPDGVVSALEWSPDGTMIASSGGSGQVRIWDVASGAAVGQTPNVGSSGLASLAWHPDGTQVASGNFDHEIRLWESLPEGTACKLAVSKLSVTTLTRDITPVGFSSCSDPDSMRALPAIPVVVSKIE
jgi:WD40 repeat protein